MSLEDEARMIVGQNTSSDLEEARHKALQTTPVVLDWTAELIAKLGAKFPHQPVYRQLGVDTNGQGQRTISYEPIGRGWGLTCFYRGTEGYKQGHSAILMQDGTLRSGNSTPVQSSYLAKHVGVAPGSNHALVAYGFLVNAANSTGAEVASYRELFGVYGVTALLSGTVEPVHGLQLTWWDPSRS